MKLQDLKNRFKLTPVSINCQLGDPFQPNQWKGTKDKLVDLMRTQHEGPVALITKSILTHEQIEWLNNNIRNLNLFIFYSVTGMQEKYGTTTVLANFKELSISLTTSIYPVIFIRPIIPGINDSADLLKDILETAGGYSSYSAVIYRGYKDIDNSFNNVPLNENFIKEFERLADLSGAVIYPKTRALAVDLNIPHLMHLDPLSNKDMTDFLKLTGYNDLFKIESKSYHVLQAVDNPNITKGDINFIKMFTRWEVKSPETKYKNQRSILSISLFGHNNIDCTSSWMGWGENKPCTIGCSYCIAYAEHKDYKEFGCNPDLLIL